MLSSWLSCLSEPPFLLLQLSGAPRNEWLGALYSERDREDNT